MGQNNREEINFQPAGGGGQNYGWRLREGSIPTPTGGVGGPAPPGAVDPVFEYSHAPGDFGRSITGGYVYRGPIEALQGLYFFADFSTARIGSLRIAGMGVAEFTEWTDTLRPDVGFINSIASFGEDNLGNLYILDLGGEVFRIQAVPVAGSLWLAGLGIGLLGLVRLGSAAGLTRC